ncbi:MAG TPA: LacI family DNA-binding transcriptional regulator [Anaerolineae bacterium]|nr:LacI family DNA-binding transcriptional regulator [Anaerolineae bacterium]HQK14458.1 LacI family DNA-binding transcriptional regulator [Anaerolineae bacterium]
MVNSVTLQDVARLAGVSIGTASQALNNRPSVAQDTRARVLDAAKTLGYPFKENGSGGHPLSVIGLLTKHDYGFPFEVNAFYSYVQAGVESECRRQNLSLMFSNIEVDLDNRPVMWPSMISEQRVDGLILAGTFIENTIGLLGQRLDIPIVLVDGYAPNLHFDSIVIENIAGAKMAVDHLVQQGHTHIGLIGWARQSPPSIKERQIGYHRTLEEHGIAMRYIEESGLNREDGYRATKQLLQRAPEVTAIFACNDLTAIGVIHAARDLGLKIPDDLSVVGFDNIDMAKEVTPPLTTVHVYKTWLDIFGVRQLIARALNPEQPKTTTTVMTDLVIRESTARPRKHAIC